MLDNLFKENFLGEIAQVTIENNAHLSYIQERTPVIIKNLSQNWPATQKWDFDYLRQKINPNLNILVKDLSTNCKFQ